jgi:hypothetical protein
MFPRKSVKQKQKQKQKHENKNKNKNKNTKTTNMRKNGRNVGVTLGSFIGKAGSLI